MSLTFTQVFNNMQRNMATDAIDEFRSHLNVSLGRQRARIEKEFSSLTPDQFEDQFHMEMYKSHLDGEFYLLDEVEKLANELAIVGLYKNVEIHTKRVVKRNIPTVNEKQLFKVDRLKKALPFKLENIDEYKAFDELRLINNSVKHNAVVNKDLAQAFPSWKEGEELLELDKHYERLLPKIKKYILSLVDEIMRHPQIPNK